MAPTDEAWLHVAVFAYAREEQLRRTLDALREAGARALTVFSDGPRPGDEEAVERVRVLVRAVDWAEVELVARPRNLGLSESLAQGLGEVFAAHERAAVIEDDVAVAPGFLRFAGRVLDAYADEPRVGGVTACRLPFPRAAVDAYDRDAFMLPRFFAWGWATWRRAWERWDTDGARVVERLRARPVPLEAAGADLPYMVRKAFVRGELEGAWDVAVAASLVLEEQLFVVPARNMAENSGFEVGTHPQAPRWELRWEDGGAGGSEPRLPPVEVDRAIHRAYLRWRENPAGTWWRDALPGPVRAALRRARGTYDVFRGSSES